MGIRWGLLVTPFTDCVGEGWTNEPLTTGGDAADDDTGATCSLHLDP